MGGQEPKKAKKHICAGLLAHVDAGKTTLSEAMLYISGSIRELGRVDHGNTFFDTGQMERARGITIFSKEALLSFGGVQALRDEELDMFSTVFVGSSATQNIAGWMVTPRGYEKK